MSKKLPSVYCRTCANRKGSIFCDLGSDHLKELEEAKTTNYYKPHQVLFYEGNQPHGLYCLNNGKVKVYKTDTEGHQQIVRLIGPGEVVGYRSLLANEPYSATAETLEESNICFIDKKTFVHILETHPKTAIHVMTMLATDLGHAENQMLKIVHKNIRERLAELLLTFNSRYGKEVNGGIRLDISLTREEMAELVGTTQESIIRLVSEFKQDGLIAVRGREITLLDLPRLVKTANLPD